MFSPQRDRRALTLVEVLVVVAIIGLLLALLFPAIMRLREYASQHEDFEQLRKLGKAWIMYAQTHQGHTVTHKTSDPHDRWIKKLGPYTDNIDDCIISQGDPNRQARRSYMERNLSRKTSSFVLNPYFSTTIFDPVTGKLLSCEKLSDCTSLSTAIAILPVSTAAGVPGPGYIFPQGWLAGPPELAWKRTTGRLGIHPDRFLTTSDSSSRETPGRANYLFADGHVETINAERVRLWIDQGKNFLIPEH
jgi:prepilin-type processing-associated H-X9-DG protein/prepilin-type N-terminal cleavage/methylation domain-containing protein